MQWRQKTTAKSTKAPPPKPRAPKPPPAKRPPPDRDGDAEKPRKPKLSRLQKPAGMSLEEWQIELRRQFGREQNYLLKNLGDEPIFSEFEVTNPQTRGAYRVQIRGAQPGD